MKLYYAPAACSLAVHIALREAGLAFDLVKVDLGRHQLGDGSLLTAVNPKNYVPVVDRSRRRAHRGRGDPAMGGRAGARQPPPAAFGDSGAAARARVAQLHRHRAAQGLLALALAQGDGARHT
ncbi:Glutathione S-transferase [Rubellimicrobium mesophilum DSM 19309]|uniref:Glutathione S-transferase n=1 Tax=Rubellimicrobium mesophilum DSM 19309 TaxID=442562 RepID=A0A017HPU0_9RHOB|nr:Glutathione S-transferase [Rubellimicrobium mesophilum DSM 19309]